MPQQGHPKDHPYYTANSYRLPERIHHRDSGCPLLGHAIAKARIAADLKQSQLADLIGVARSRIAQWEGAKRPVPWSKVKPLTDALKMHGAWSTIEPYHIHMKAGQFARMCR